MKIREVLDLTTDYFVKNKIQEPRLDAEVLLSATLGINRMDLFLQYNKELKNKFSVRFKEWAKKRVKKNPVAYITGKKEFMGLEFIVNRDVFIPRPETELLVEEAIKTAKSLLANSHNSLSILDIGTGCGNIAVSLAKYLSNVKIIATDISKNALEVAQKNAKLNNVSNKIIFLNGNLFQPFTIYHLPFTAFEIIISNPPYIRTKDISKLQEEILYEPVSSIDGGKDGFVFYKKIISESIKFLVNNGYIFLEIGFDQNDGVKRILKDCKFKNIKSIKDYSGYTRVIIGKYYGRVATKR